MLFSSRKNIHVYNDIDTNDKFLPFYFKIDPIYPINFEKVINI